MANNAVIVDDSAPMRTSIVRGVAEGTTRIADVMAMGDSLADAKAVANACADLILQDVRLPDTNRSAFVEVVRNSVGK